jgi:tetratricopeptide (TPR) repeat protein
MTNSADGPQKKGASFELNSTRFGSEQKEQFENLIKEARSQPEMAEENFAIAATLAKEWQEGELYMMVTSELANVYKSEERHDDEFKALRKLESFYSDTKNYPLMLISIDRRMGVCYRNQRNLDKAIEYLRSAVQRCQSGEVESMDEFVDSLCELANIYALKGWSDRARTCMRQAHALVSDEDGRPDLQARVIEELARITLIQHRPKEATSALLHVLKSKYEIYGSTSPQIAETLVSLAMSLVDQGNLDDAESALIQALDIMRHSRLNRIKHSASINKLAGVFRKQGRFLESTFLEQGASEILGRGVDQRLGVFKQFDAGLAAQRAKHYDVALDCYRSAMKALEHMFDKYMFFRVPILCRMAEMADERKQKMQFKSILIEIDEGLSQLTTKAGADLPDRLVHLARLFRLLKYDSFADSCFRFVGKMHRSKNDLRLNDVYAEHLRLLDLMPHSGETQHMQRYLRRSTKLLTAAKMAVTESYIDIAIGSAPDEDVIVAEIL